MDLDCKLLFMKVDKVDTFGTVFNSLAFEETSPESYYLHCHVSVSYGFLCNFVIYICMYWNHVRLLLLGFWQ